MRLAAGLAVALTLLAGPALAQQMSIDLGGGAGESLSLRSVQLLLLVTVCDVVLGPALTFVAFRPGKKGLKFDLVVIAMLQLGALGYGVHTVFIARPVFTVFAVDRFELVSEADIEPEQLAKASSAYRELSVTGPRLVAAELPADAGERSTLLMAAATQGIDLKHLPQHYRDFDTVRLKGLAKSMPVERLREYNEPARVEAVMSDLGRTPQSMRYYPLRGVKRDLTVFVDATTGRILRIANLAPWPR